MLQNTVGIPTVLNTRNIIPTILGCSSAATTEDLRQSDLQWLAKCDAAMVASSYHASVTNGRNAAVSLFSRGIILT